MRLWDLFNEPGYMNAAIRKQAAEWAFSKSPGSAREFVAEFQFYDAEVRHQGDKLLGEVTKELSNALAIKEIAKGSKLTQAEIQSVTRELTRRILGRELPALGPAAKNAASAKALDLMSQAVPADSARTAGPMRAVDVAWQLNLDAQTGQNASGLKNIGPRTDSELVGYIKSISNALGFSNSAEGAYHAHKHSKELATATTPSTEMTTYLQEARKFISEKPGTIRQNQNGSRSVVFESNGIRAIVTVTIDGNTSIATFGSI